MNIINTKSNTSTTNTVVFYHGCCADGAAAAMRYSELTIDDDVVYKPIFYPQAVNLNTLISSFGDLNLDNTTAVVFLDFCPKGVTLLGLAETCGKVIVVDHHQTAIDVITDMVDMPDNIGYVICEDNVLSGAALAFVLSYDLVKLQHKDIVTPSTMKYVSSSRDYCSLITTNIDISLLMAELTEFYELIRVRDVWDEDNPEVKKKADHLNVFLNHNSLKSFEAMRYETSTRSLESMVDEGGRIAIDVTKQCMGYIESGISLKVGNINIMVVEGNANYASETGDIWSKRHPNEPSLCVMLVFGDGVGLAIRSNKLYSALKVAMEFGGGGHEQASGAPYIKGYEDEVVDISTVAQRVKMVVEKLSST